MIRITGLSKIIDIFKNAVKQLIQLNFITAEDNITFKQYYICVLITRIISVSARLYEFALMCDKVPFYGNIK